jgi:chromosomal replication initiator protein
LNFNEPKRQSLELNEVAGVIAKHYGVSVIDIKSKKRNKSIATVRQVACFLMKKHTPHSLQAIGTFFGGRDHSTIIHAITRVEELVKKDTSFAQRLKRVEDEIINR